jgi:4a-hydroxytetrahydrobiopterin dehydratase
MKKYKGKLSEIEIESESDVLGENWETVNLKKLKRIFEFETFMDAINFIGKIAQISETINHHPDITIFYNKVIIEISTHKIRGLTKLDFVLAKRIENDFKRQTGGRKSTGRKIK